MKIIRKQVNIVNILISFVAATVLTGYFSDRICPTILSSPLVFVSIVFALLALLLLLVHFWDENKELISQLGGKSNPKCRKSLLCNEFWETDIPTEFKINGIIPHKNTFNYSGVKPGKYSDYAQKIASEQSIRNIFTVFAINPVIIFREAAKALAKDDYATLHLEDDVCLLKYIKINKAEFWKHINQDFPHFVLFEQLAKTKEVVRILIDSDYNKLENYTDYLSLFSELGFSWTTITRAEQSDTKCQSRIKCYVVHERYFRSNDYLLSDHVFYEGASKNLLAVYDLDAKSLMVTYEEFADFPDTLVIKHYQAHKDAYYVDLGVFIANNSKRVKSHLYHEFCYVSALPSIEEQRAMQVKKIIEINPKTILSIGIGYGEEINDFIKKLTEHYSPQENSLRLQSIKCVDPNKDAGININHDVTPIKIIIDNKSDLLNLSDDSIWECIQCGFVLHDIMGQVSPSGGTVKSHHSVGQFD